MKQLKSKFNNIRFPYVKCGMRTLKQVSILLFSTTLFAFSPSTVVSEKLKHNTDESSRVGAIKLLQIKGNVTGPEGMPLPGVSIIIKGSALGTQTDFDGNFSISANKGEILVISYLGMKTLEIVVTDLTTLNIVMTEDTTSLDEIVVIGYGSVKKSDLTGSVSSLKGNKVQDQATFSVEGLLAGRVAGVKVIDGAQPGAGGSIQIRGSNSMLGGTEPLYVVDGIPIEPNVDAQGQDIGGSQNSAINFIDPSSIKSMEILKDASATAIYGARGANGVVLITTIQGSKDKRELTYRYSLNVSQVSNQLDILDGPGFANFVNLASANISYLKQSYWGYQQQLLDAGTITQLPSSSPWGTTNTPSGNSYRWVFDGEDRPLPYASDLPNTDWQDEVFQTAFTHNYNLGYSGGSEKGSFSVGLNYLDQEGILIGSGYQRINMYMNLNQTITPKIKVTTRINLTKGNANTLMTNNGSTDQNLISKILNFAPTNGLNGGSESLGEFDFNDPNFLDTPIDIATKYIDEKEQINMLGSFGLNYKLAKGLVFNGTSAITYALNNRDTYWPQSTFRGAATNGNATSAKNQFFKYLTQFQLSYYKKFNKNHEITAVAVTSKENFKRRQDYVNVKNFPSDILGFHNLEAGLDFSVPINNFNETTLRSYLGRVNYTLLDKYLFTASIRADGSSLFAENNKWAYFPSGAVAWKMSKEPFIEKLNVFSDLKLRLSYGKTGGQAIQPYQSLATLTTKNYSFNGNIASGYIENNLENPDLRWETTDQFDVGLDMAFANNRIKLTFDAYYKKTTDLLMIVENPPSSGFATKIANIGAVENKGFEVESSAVVLNGDLKWNVAGNIAFNRNKVLEMGVNDFQYGSYTTNGGGQPIIFKEGQPLGAFIGFQKVKIFETWEEVQNSAQPGASVGDMMFIDHDNNKVLNNDDTVIIGDPNPDAIWGITNEFSYKSFDLSFLIDGQVGGDIYSIADMELGSNYRQWNSSTSSAINSWVPAAGVPGASWELQDGSTFSTEGYNYGFGNSNAYTARPMYNVLASAERKRVSDEYIKDASFIKLRNVSIGYNFNSKKIKSYGIQRMRFYLSATNLLIITKFDGYDPEVTAFTGNASRRGLDFGTYPVSRTVALGIDVAF
jgi:TonB-linked SusC/RagA family outer membrane protein